MSTLHLTQRQLVRSASGRLVPSQSQSQPQSRVKTQALPQADTSISSPPLVGGYTSGSNYTSPRPHDSFSPRGIPGGQFEGSTTASATGVDTVVPSSVHPSPQHNATVRRGELHNFDGMRSSPSGMEDVDVEQGGCPQSDYGDEHPPQRLGQEQGLVSENIDDSDPNNVDLSNNIRQFEDDTDKSVRTEGEKSYYPPSDTDPEPSQGNKPGQRTRRKKSISNPQVKGKGKVIDVPFRTYGRKPYSIGDDNVAKSRQNVYQKLPVQTQQFGEGPNTTHLPIQNSAKRLYEHRANRAQNQSEHIVMQGQIDQPSSVKLTSKRVAKPSFFEGGSKPNTAHTNLTKNKTRFIEVATTSKGVQKNAKRTKESIIQTTQDNSHETVINDLYGLGASSEDFRQQDRIVKQRARAPTTSTKLAAQISIPKTTKTNSSVRSEGAQAQHDDDIPKVKSLMEYVPESQRSRERKMPKIVEQMAKDDIHNRPVTRNSTSKNTMTKGIHPADKVATTKHVKGYSPKQKQSPAMHMPSPKPAPASKTKTRYDLRTKAKIVQNDTCDGLIVSQDPKEHLALSKVFYDPTTHLSPENDQAVAIKTIRLSSVGGGFPDADADARPAATAPGVIDIAQNISARKQLALQKQSEPRLDSVKSKSIEEEVMKEEKHVFNTRSAIGKRERQHTLGVRLPESKKSKTSDTLSVPCQSVEYVGLDLPTRQVNRQISISDTGSPSLVPNNTRRHQDSGQDTVVERILRQTGRVALDVQVSNNSPCPAPAHELQSGHPAFPPSNATAIGTNQSQSGSQIQPHQSDITMGPHDSKSKAVNGNLQASRQNQKMMQNASHAQSHDLPNSISTYSAHHSHTQVDVIPLMTREVKQAVELQPIKDAYTETPSNQLLFQNLQTQQRVSKVPVAEFRHTTKSRPLETYDNVHDRRVDQDHDDIFYQVRDMPHQQQSSFVEKLRRDSQARVAAGASIHHPKSQQFAKELLWENHEPQVAPEVHQQKNCSATYGVGEQRGPIGKLHSKSSDFAQALFQHDIFGNGGRHAEPQRYSRQQDHGSGFYQRLQDGVSGVTSSSHRNQHVYQATRLGYPNMEKGMPQNRTAAKTDSQNRWQDAVDKATASLMDTMHSVTNSLLRHLFSKEQAIAGIVEEYKHNSRRITTKLLLRQRKDLKDVALSFEKDCQKLTIVYSDAYKVTRELKSQLLHKNQHVDAMVPRKRQKLHTFRDSVDAARRELKGTEGIIITNIQKGINGSVEFCHW